MTKDGGPLEEEEENVIEWEKITSNLLGDSMWRTSVPGGWLVRNMSDSTMVYIADPKHEWTNED